MIEPKDVQALMNAGDQVPCHDAQLLYWKLIREEREEMQAGWFNRDRVEILDGGIDLIWVTLGFLYASGFTTEQIEAAWREVSASNMSKIDESTGKVIKREDGKILKPASYFKPNIAAILEREE